MGEGSEAREDQPPDGLEEFREEAQVRYQEPKQSAEPRGGVQNETEESEQPEPGGLEEFRRQIAAKYPEADSP